MHFLCMTKNYHRNKYACLHRLAQDPDLTAVEAAEIFEADVRTVRKWAKEANISLSGHKHGRVKFILNLKEKKRKRLITELAQLERDIRELRELDPDAPYIKKSAKAKKVS